MINDFADQVQVESSAKINDIPSAAEPDCQLFCNNSGAVHRLYNSSVIPCPDVERLGNFVDCIYMS